MSTRLTGNVKTVKKTSCYLEGDDGKEYYVATSEMRGRTFAVGTPVGFTWSAGETGLFAHDVELTPETIEDLTSTTKIPALAVLHRETSTEEHRVSLSTDWPTAAEALSQVFGGVHLGKVAYTNSADEKVVVRSQADWEDCVRLANPTATDPLVLEFHDNLTDSGDEIDVLPLPTPRGNAEAEGSSTPNPAPIPRDDLQGHARLTLVMVLVAMLLMTVLALGTVTWSFRRFKAMTQKEMQALSQRIEVSEAKHALLVQRFAERQEHVSNEAYQMLLQRVSAFEEQQQELQMSTKRLCTSPPTEVTATELTATDEPTSRSVGDALRDGITWALRLPFRIGNLVLGGIRAVFSAIAEACKAVGRLAAHCVRLLRHSGEAAVAAGGSLVEGSPRVAPLVIGLVAGIGMTKMVDRLACTL